jgi:hypothetical protein
MKYRTLWAWVGMRFRTAWLAGASAATLLIAGCGSDSAFAPATTAAPPPVPLTIIEANLDTQAAIVGGATSAAAYYKDGANTEWTVYSMANRLAATAIGPAKGAANEIALPGYIQNITPVSFSGKNYALVAMGEKGLAVVDLSDPTALALLNVVNVNYEKTGLNWVDGGGNPVTAATIAGTAGAITTVVTDGTALFIGNAKFGIHKTALSNLLPTPTLEADGTLKIDSEVWALQYAGENPWGAPESLKLHGGKLYAALGFLGIAIYDPADLSIKPARYNLYTDETVSEDWFAGRSLKGSVQNTAFLDPDTGMPNWEQAAWEINDYWRTGKSDPSLCRNSDWCTPWASFDRYGKYYYRARALDVVDLPAASAGGSGTTTMAYVAYSLGGLVAVNVTAGGTPTYAGYVAAVPAHGPDEPTGTQSKSIFPHFGSGMLKEAGVMDVRVKADATGTGYKAYYSDHFAGLVVAGGAERPRTNWKNAGAPYNNDIFPLDPFWPDYEFVTSYDMTPVTLSGSDESMPQFVVPDASGKFPAPVLLATGEISGHGGSLFLMPGMNTGAAGQIDIVQATGAGGLNFIDIKTFSGAALADYFNVPVRHVSTAEKGAAPDGSASQTIAIGHAEGVTVSGNHVYLADGPHGMSVWRIADAAGAPTDDVHLVANTLQSEYPSNGILPTPHAFKVGFGADPNKAFVLSQSLGLRRVDVSAVPGAGAGTPKLLTLSASDIFEHSTELYDAKAGGITSQDHAYGVAFTGNYAVVADGGNGLTVYDITKDPTTGTAGHIVANIGGSEKKKPILGRAAAVKLWTNPATKRTYAIVAAGSYGVSVVEMTDLLDKGIKPGLTLVKTFEPKKYEEDKVGSADGKSVDVHVVGEHAYFSYDSFGLVAYKLTDLVQPVVEFQPTVPAGLPANACADVTDVTKLSTKQGRAVDCRPEDAGRFKLQLQPGYEAVDGGALYMTSQYFPANTLLRNGAGTVYTLDKPRALFYVAYGAAGVVKLDWSDPAKPVMTAIKDTVGSAAATAIANGRVYVADGTGGMVVFK